MTRPESHIIDSLRTACLCDVGCTDFVAVVVVGADGAEHLALAECVSIAAVHCCYELWTASSKQSLTPPALPACVVGRGWVRRMVTMHHGHRRVRPLTCGYMGGWSITTGK
jgi:hypothetical protein